MTNPRDKASEDEFRVRRRERWGQTFVGITMILVAFMLVIGWRIPATIAFVAVSVVTETYLVYRAVMGKRRGWILSGRNEMIPRGTFRYGLELSVTIVAVLVFPPLSLACTMVFSRVLQN